MDNLVNSLPIIEWGSGRFNVYSSVSPDEGNVCTKEQVQAATEKSWRAYYEASSNRWQKYEGSDDTSAIDGIKTEADKDAPVYNLRGQRLTAPQKGVNIIGGRKVVVK
ncbi:MAG: hypothetical protein K2M96_04605 [Prevotella sp.]|nr:hypothetical protein [Prevotella sp.]